MSCPYLAKATDRTSREPRPDMSHVCYAYSAENPYWNYTTVSAPVQEVLCMKKRSYAECPRYIKAQGQGVETPMPVPTGGGSSWWPF